MLRKMPLEDNTNGISVINEIKKQLKQYKTNEMT